MTSLGRGRGWASAQSKESVLRRPGGTVSPKEVDVSSLISEINLIDSEASLRQRVREVRNQLQNFASKENLKHAVNKLYKQGLDDREFGWKFSMLYADSAIQQISDEEHNLRYYWLQSLQTDYTRRKELQQESAAQFRNAVLLLCEAYHCIKLNNKSSVRVLEEPLMDYLNMLLESAALEDIEILAQQVTLNGINFLRHHMEMEKLVMNIRQAIITKKLCPTSRALLLYIIDFVNHNSGVLPDNLQKFYVSQLGDKSYVMKYPIYAENDGVTATDYTRCSLEPNENSDHEVDSLNMLMRVPLLDGPPKTDVREQRHYPVSYNNAVPRAIRGSGGGGEHKSHGKPHMNAPAPKQSSNNKGWGHDDRFEKDYE